MKQKFVLTCIVWLSWLWVFSASAIAKASSVEPPPVDIEMLAKHSHLVVVGQCKDIFAQWDQNQKIISTYATYEVEERIKGLAPNEELIVKTPGGTVGHISQVLIGAPQFQVGERNLLFLIPFDDPNTYRTYALGQGKLSVLRDEAGIDILELKAIAEPDSLGLPIENSAQINPKIKNNNKSQDRKQFELGKRPLLSDVVKAIKSIEKSQSI